MPFRDRNFINDVVNNEIRNATTTELDVRHAELLEKVYHSDLSYYQKRHADLEMKLIEIEIDKRVKEELEK